MRFKRVNNDGFSIIKRLLIIVVLISGIFIISLMTIMKIYSYINYLNDTKYAKKYVKNRFDYEIKLISSMYGNDYYPSSFSNGFIFYDTKNKVYFVVICYKNTCTDFYSESTSNIDDLK